MWRLAFLVEVLDNVPESYAEVGGVPERAVGQVVVLEVAPASFDVVQLREVARQPLDGDLGPLGQRRPGGPAGVDGVCCPAPARQASRCCRALGHSASPVAAAS